MKLNFFAAPMIAALCFAVLGCQTTSPDRFAQADADHSGKLSRDEVNSYLVIRIFESRDSNRDGKLTKAEWLAGNDAGQERIFRDRDANHDGVVTLDEALSYGQKKGMANKLVREADTDKDGLISREEATAYYGSKEGAPN